LECDDNPIGLYSKPKMPFNSICIPASS
jgi:hypothetical protein